ncbi:MAG: cytochrome P450 [Pseudomonadales bacterium]
MSRTQSVDGVPEINFNTEPFLTDFKQIYHNMHTSGCPFAHSTSGDHYAVASHAMIMDILKNYSVWKSKFGPGLDYQPEGQGVLVSVDPPEHTFEVRIVANSFSLDYFKSLEPEMEAYVNEQIDKWYADGQVEIHDALSLRLPMFVIFRILGIPMIDEAGDKLGWVRDGIIAMVGSMLMNPDERQEAMASGALPQRFIAGVGETHNMFVEHLARCKAALESGDMQPDSNVVCRFLTTPGPDGTYLSDQKILGFCGFLLTAGSATTTIMLSNIVYRMLTEPGVYDRLREDPALREKVIEETLRLDAPVQGLFRTNDEDVDLGPIHVDKDTKVMLLWAAANLDPDMYDDPLKFDVDRDLAKVRRHLSFGYGTHFCRGAPLARLEGDVFLRIILERLHNLRLAEGKDVVMEKRMPVLQGIQELHIAWDVE